jgi:hypothetical protein
MTRSDVVGVGVSVAIPLACMGASICGWHAGGTRSRLAASTMAGIVGACLAYVVAGTVIDLEPYFRAFAVALIGLAAGTITLGRRWLDLA